MSSECSSCGRRLKTTEIGRCSGCRNQRTDNYKKAGGIGVSIAALAAGVVVVVKKVLKKKSGAA